MSVYDIIGQVIWKELGWSTIIYLAAITAVDTQLYEAAEMDGAGRLRKTWHVTLPAIRPVIIVLLILKSSTSRSTISRTSSSIPIRKRIAASRAESSTVSKKKPPTA